MAKRPAKHSRSQDQARLAEEKAAPRKGGRPQKWPGATPAERDAARSRAKRARAKAAVEAAFAAGVKPPVPPKVDSIHGEVFGSGPPKTEPELAPGPTDDDGRPLSHLWDIVRGSYPEHVTRAVDTLMRRRSLELDDLVWLEFAEHGMLVEQRTQQTANAALQSRKQMARLLVARGPITGVNDVPVRVPDGLDLDALTRPPDEGDNIRHEPTDADLPEHYRGITA